MSELSQSSISMSETERQQSSQATSGSMDNQPPPSSQSDYLSSAIPLPKPPENPANTVPSKTLWMGDIEPWWDEDYVLQIWQKMNKRVQVKVIKPKQGLLMHQIANSNGQSNFSHSGYCFIEFDTPEDANEALTLNGSMIPNSNNKLFRLNWASAATLNSQIAQTPEYSLFVGDLSPGTTEAHLLALFQTHFGSVKTVRVMTDPATGLSRCFGFVRFSNEDDRKRALVEMNGKWLGGRPIRVALATPKHQNMYHKNSQNAAAVAALSGVPIDPMEQQNMYMAAAVGGQMPPPPMGYYGPPQGFGGPNGSPTNQPVAAAAAAQAFNDPNNTTVFVGGLSSVVTEDTLMTLFEPFGQIIHVKVPPGKGCGFVKFTRREDAEQAIAGMQGFIIGGSRIRLSWGRSNNRNHQQQMMIAASGANPLSRASFDFAAGVQQPSMNQNRQPADPYPSSNQQGGMVGIPAGIAPAPMFYDPYFGSGGPPPNTSSTNHPTNSMDTSDLQQGNGAPPQQFAIDQNGQYMYLAAAQPFPNPVMSVGMPGGDSEGGFNDESNSNA